MSIPKDTAKTLLQRQVEKIPDLRAKGHQNPEFEPWRQQTLRIIKRIFGGSSDEAKQFDSISFGLIAFTNRTPESAWEEAFQRGLANSEVTLRSFAEELDLFEPVKTITTKTKGSPPGDERAIVWDLFICHASEDKNEIAGPLAEALTAKGLSVWYDEFTLTLGDSLSRKIDEGLANSRFGVVILSPSFFKKEWPRRELDGLTAKEVSSGKTILPVWHNVDRDIVLRFSPVLADKLAASTKEGLVKVVDEVLKAVKKDKAFEGQLEQEPVTPEQKAQDSISTKASKTSDIRILSYLRSNVTSYLQVLSDPERHFEKLILDETSLDSIAVDHSDLVSLMTDFRGRARELNDLVDSYVRIAESKIEYLQTPDSHSTLTRLMGGEELGQLEKSRKWKQWAKDQAALIDLKRRRMLEVVEKLKASLDGALQHEGAHST